MREHSRTKERMDQLLEDKLQNQLRLPGHMRGHENPDALLGSQRACGMPGGTIPGDGQAKTSKQAQLSKRPAEDDLFGKILAQSTTEYGHPRQPLRLQDGVQGSHVHELSAEPDP